MCAVTARSGEPTMIHAATTPAGATDVDGVANARGVRQVAMGTLAKRCSQYVPAGKMTGRPLAHWARAAR